jgi:hypothetical protein
MKITHGFFRAFSTARIIALLTGCSLIGFGSVQAYELPEFQQRQRGDNADPDGDGLTNTQEFTAGTDPINAASVLKVTNFVISDGDFRVSFPTVSGKTYRLERSDTLQAGSWTTLLDNIAGTGGAVQVTDVGAAAQSKRFYRIVIP